MINDGDLCVDARLENIWGGRPNDVSKLGSVHSQGELSILLSEGGGRRQLLGGELDGVVFNLDGQLVRDERLGDILLRLLRGLGGDGWLNRFDRQLDGLTQREHLGREDFCGFVHVEFRALRTRLHGGRRALVGERGVDGRHIRLRGKILNDTRQLLLVVGKDRIDHLAAGDMRPQQSRIEREADDGIHGRFFVNVQCVIPRVNDPVFAIHGRHNLDGGTRQVCHTRLQLGDGTRAVQAA